MKHLDTAIRRACFFIGLMLFVLNATAQETKSEYLTLRVQYGKTMAGYKYEIFVDIGISGAHSLSGKVTNSDDVVIIDDDNGKYEFKSDIDLLNYFGKNGWVIIQTGEVDVLDQHYYTYLMERKYTK
jgi:hypothetical protein